MQRAIIVATRDESAVIGDGDNLAGLRVGAVEGQSYGATISGNPDIRLQYAVSDEANIERLLSGKLDAALGESVSMTRAIKASSGSDRIAYDLNQPVAALDIFFVFRDDDNGRRHCKLVSDGLERLRNEGTLYELFGYE